MGQFTLTKCIFSHLPFVVFKQVLTSAASNIMQASGILFVVLKTKQRSVLSETIPWLLTISDANAPQNKGAEVKKN